MNRKATEPLAIDGGPKAVEHFEGKTKPKIGVREFLELADLWGFSQKRTRRLREALDGADEELGAGPHLNRYPNPKPSKVDQFEKAMADITGAKHCYAVSSGTGALHAAYTAVGVGPGDEVIVPAYTFMATASTVVLCRAVPVFCEVDESLTIDPADLERCITKRTKAIAPVHMNGAVCDMDAVMRIARKHKLAVVEDCAQAFGAGFRGKRVGTIGDAGAFSISSYKPVGGGECGMLVTRTKKLLQRAQQLAECGGLWRPVRFAPQRWPGELFSGSNYRCSQLEGAVNLVQIRKADAQLKQWRTNKRRILAKLQSFEGIRPQVVHDPDGEVARQVIFFPPTAAESRHLVAVLRAEGLSAGTRGDSHPDWHLAHDMFPVTGKGTPTPEGCPFTCPHYTKGGPAPNYGPAMCPRTRDLNDRAVNVSIGSCWTARDCTTAAVAINKVLGAYYAPDPDGTWLP